MISCIGWRHLKFDKKQQIFLHVVWAQPLTSFWSGYFNYQFLTSNNMQLEWHKVMQKYILHKVTTTPYELMSSYWYVVIWDRMNLMGQKCSSFRINQELIFLSVMNLIDISSQNIFFSNAFQVKIIEKQPLIRGQMCISDSRSDKAQMSNPRKWLFFIGLNNKRTGLSFYEETHGLNCGQEVTQGAQSQE